MQGRKTHTKFAAFALALTVICAYTYAQPVDIPDPNLRSAIHNVLGLDRPIITQADMLRLEALPAELQGITDLTGIEYALNLNSLFLQGNNITNLAPLATLTTLEYLYLAGNHSITDISPLSSLTGLKRLYLDFNRISDIHPLAGLTALTHLGLTHNSISDVNPLAGLYNLEILHIQNNSIADHSPLDGLALSLYEYDQSCDMLPEPLEPRLNNRSFPSIFAAFLDGIHNRPDLESISDYWDRRIAMGAEHDLFFSSPDMFSQRFMEIKGEWHLRGLMPQALDRRDRYFARNPNMIFLAEVRIRDYGNHDAFPDDHPYWLRDAEGNIVYEDSYGWRLINYAHPVVQDIIVGQALAISRCGLYDGVFFDHWDDHHSTVGDYIPNDIAQRARDNIIRRIREGTRPDFLIMGNTNFRIIPRTGPHMNGGFMETLLPGDWHGVEVQLDIVREALHWLETNVREPRINGLEGLVTPTEPPDGPTNRQWMRAITSLGLTHSDGYVLFAAHPNHGHYWYDFWDADLGQPVGPKSQLYDEDTPGLYIREFTNGWAVYNHSGAPQTITLPEEVQGVASRLSGTEHALGNIDGEMYLKAVVSDQPPVTSKNPADVNGDGVVNILDLTLVAQAFGKDGLQGDVNEDGVVNVFDLVFVANQF